MEKVKENTINKKSKTFEIPRLQEIFTKLPDTNLTDCRNFYTKDLESKSEYLQNRAKKFLALIEEAETLILESSENKEITDRTEKINVEKENKEEVTTTVTTVKTEIENKTEKLEEKTNTEVINKETDAIIEDLSVPEKKLLEKTMKETSLLPFESPKANKNLQTFVQNQIVKRFSGISASEKIKDLTNKISKKLILTVAIATLWPNEAGGGDYTMPAKDSNNKITILKQNAVEKKATTHFLTSKEQQVYNLLPENARNIYLYACDSIKESYLMIDKPTATMYVIGENKNLIASFPILLGKTKGETPNMADAYSDVASNATTPAGKFKLGKMADSQNVIKEDSILYKGRIISILGTNDIALHSTYPGEFTKRTQALNTPTTIDNRMSWGCINISPNNFNKIIKPNFNKGNQWIFITPDIVENSSEQLILNPKTGKLEKKKDKINKTLAQSKQTKKLGKNNT